MPAIAGVLQPWNTAMFSATAIRCAASSRLVEVDVERAPVVVAKLGERDGEVGAQLDQRQHAPLQRGHAFARG